MIAGIDLGFKGAFSIIDASGKSIKVIDMPTYTIEKSDTERDAYDIIKISNIVRIELSVCSVVFIEKLQPVSSHFSGISGSANFHMGFGLGLIQGLLEHTKVPYQLVRAKEWQKHFGVVKPKKSVEKWSTKAPVYEIAHRLFPDVELTTQRGRIIDGRSDSLLIAEYGRRSLSGVKNV